MNDLTPPRAVRRLVGVWFVDLVGYTTLSARDAPAAMAIVGRFQSAVQERVAHFGGRLVKFTGDGAMADFPSVDAAVRCALSVREELGNASFTPRIRIRVGIHVGEVLSASDGDIYGDGVNIAARLQQEAEPDQILVSDEVRRHLRAQPDLRFHPTGERSLRGIPERVRLFSVEFEDVTPGEPVDPRSVAVLPFADLGADGEDEWLAEGITEEVIGALSRVRGLHVASRTSSFALQGVGLTVEEVAERLRVAAVLEGSVRRRADGLRILTRLIEAHGEGTLWAETFDADLASVFEVQERIARSVIEALEVQAAADEDALVRRPTEEPDAYRLYLKGRYHWNRHTRADLERSVECFEEAIALDPSYALAHAGLADSHLTLGALFMPPYEAYPKAKVAARRALELDENLPDAHAALGEALMRYEWDWSGAEREFRRALELDPDCAQALRTYANYLRDMGRLDEAIAMIRRARSVDPLSLPIAVAVAGIYFFARRYDEAVAECRRLLAESPFSFHALYYLGFAYEQKGMYEEAEETFQRMVSLARLPGSVAPLGRLYALTGRREEAERILAELARRSENEYVSPVFLAIVHAALGDLDRAFAWFDRGVAERSNWLTSLRIDPRYDAIRSEPRFRRLMAKVGLLQEEPERAPRLPSVPTSLVGREREIGEVLELLNGSDARVVTLTGPGGTGKTRLAIEVARAGRRSFPDGVHFVPLIGVESPMLVAAEIVRALNLPESGSVEPVAALAEHLSGKRALVVLDGFERLVRAGPDVAGLLGDAPGSRLLVTSREPLRIRGEVDYPVPPLDPDSEAVELFVQRARAVKPGFGSDPRGVAEIVEVCRRLDGLPLAIELAAARIRHISPATMLERLDDRFALLRSGPRDVPEHHQTLRGTFDWSYAQLSEEEQALFRHVAVFIGGFSLEAAEVTTRPVDPDFLVFDGLASLVDKSLVRQSEAAAVETRYEMLETIREYGLLLLAESGETDASMQRLGEYYLYFAGRAESRLEGSEQAVWLDRLEAEHATIMAVLDWMLERGQVENAVRLGSALWWFWWVRGHFSQMRWRLERALERAESLSPSLRANLLVATGALVSVDGDRERATRLFESAVEIERRREGRTGVPRALRSFGFALASRGEYGRAATLFEEALSRDRELGDSRGETADLRALGKIETDRENRETARDLFQRALSIAERSGDRHSVAFSLTGLGEVARLEGQPGRAAALYARSLEVFRELGSKPGVAYALKDLADTERESGNLDAARLLYGQALDLLDELGNRRRLLECLTGIGALALAEGREERGSTLLGAIEAQARDLPGAATTRLDETLHSHALEDSRIVQDLSWDQMLDLAREEVRPAEDGSVR